MSAAAAFSLAPFVHLLNPSSRNTSNTKMTTAAPKILMKSPAFYKNDLEARTDFVCDRHKFLDYVVDAVQMEEMDDDARRFLDLFVNNGYTWILLRLLKNNATDTKTRKKIFLALGNLLASVDTRVSSAAVVAINNEMEPVFEALNSTNDKLQKGAAFVLMNFAKHKWDGEIEVVLHNLNDSNFYAQTSKQALRDILWAHLYSKNEALISLANLVKILETYQSELFIMNPALQILADRTDESIPAEFMPGLLATLTGLAVNHAVKGETRMWTYFNLANLLAEDGADHEQFLNDDMLVVLTRDITNHFEMGEDHEHFAVEALWCVGNVIAKRTPNPFKLLNLYTFHDLTRILRHADCALDDYAPSARTDTLMKLVDESFATLRRHREAMSPSAVYDFLSRELEQAKNVVWAGRHEAIFSELHRLLNREDSMIDLFVSDIPLLLTISQYDSDNYACMMELMRLITYAVLDADAANFTMDVEAATILYEILKRLSTRLPTFLIPQVEDAFEVLDHVFEVAEADEATVEAEEDDDEDMPDFSKVRVHWFSTLNQQVQKCFIELPYTDLCEFLAENECSLGENTKTVYWRLMPTAAYSQATVSIPDLNNLIVDHELGVEVEKEEVPTPTKPSRLFYRVFTGPNQSYCVKVDEFDVFIRKYYGSGSHRIWYTTEEGAERCYFVSEESIKDLAALEGASIAIVLSAKEAHEEKDDNDSVEDMEIDDDASASAAVHEASPASEPATATSETPFNCFETGFYVSSAIDLMLGFGRFNASRTVHELINLLAANNCASTPIPAHVSLSAAEMVMLERLGYILNRGHISINPYVSMAVAPMKA